MLSNFILIILSAISTYFFPYTFFTVIINLITLFCIAYNLGKYLKNKFQIHFYFSFLIYFFLLNNLLSIIYFFFNLKLNILIFTITFYNIFILLFLVKERHLLSPITIFKKLFSPKQIFPYKEYFKNKINLFLFILNIFNFAFIFFYLKKYSFDFPVRTFWNLLNPKFFLVLFFTIFILLISQKYLKNKYLKLIINILFFNLAYSFALILYKLNYGFDPFIHEATLKEIAQNGYILPKPLYYLNYYSFIIFLNKYFGLTIAFLNKYFFIFIFNLIFLPIYFLYTEKENILFPLYLIFPFTLFINSTPQSIANILSLSFIFYYLYKNNISIFHYILALTISLIHPLSGIPFVLSLIFLQLKTYAKLKKLTLITIVFALPFTFLMFNFINPNFVTWQFNLENYKLNISLHNIKHYNFFYDTLYTILNNKIFFYFFFLILLFYFYSKNKFSKQYKDLILIHFALLFSYLLSLNLNFQQLIDYEKSNYIQRILILAFYFLYPIIILFINRIYLQSQKNKNSFIFINLILSFLILSSIYISYPRDDQYHLDRAYNLANIDLQTVHYINNNHQYQRFIVLSSQMTAVSALKEFGFHHQIETNLGKIYYYPIPTSGPLYKEFLHIVYETPDKQYIDSLFEKYQINEIFIAIPAYWHNLNQILNNLNQIQKFEKVIDGKYPMYIYHFLK